MSANHSTLLVIADSQFGAGATASAPGTWYLGLSTTVSAGDGTGFTQPSGGSYARVAVTNNTTNFPAATLSGDLAIKTNGAAIVLPDPTADWGQIIEFGWFLASTGGTPEWTFPLDSPITPRAGVPTVEFPAGLLYMPFKG